jgi:LysR family transcriptional activator of nhaA
MPEILGEFDDSALMKAFGGAGAGIFAVPTVIEQEVKKRLDLRVLGRAEDLSIAIYAISIERKIKHPAVAAICENARARLFE